MGRRAKMPQPIFVGIDVSKAKLDLAVSPTGEQSCFANDAEGIEELVTEVLSLKPTVVVIEATSGLEVALAGALAAADVAVAVVNPRHTHAFGRARGIVAKTDKVDAVGLAEFAAAVRPEVRPLPDGQAQELKALATRRRQLRQMITAEKNRLKIAPQILKPSIEVNIRWLEEQLDDIDRQMRKAIKDSPIWRAKDELLKSVPGVGDKTSAVLISNLWELGTLNSKQIAALVGVAPFNRDSGSFRGKRTCWGGRAQVRTALYMATLSAARRCPQIARFYQRLQADGKPKKVALTACMRKLIIMLNAILRDQRPWTSDHQPQT